MEGQATHLAEWEALGDWQLGDRYFERIVGAVARDVTDVVQRYLTPERAGWVMYRPSSDEPVADDADAAFALLGAEAVASLPPPPDVAALGQTPSPARVSLDREEGDVRVYRTPAGVPVLVRRRPGAPIAHIGVYATGGASSEPDALGGLSTLLMRTSLKGTERRSAAGIAEESELLGAVIGTSATADGVGWTISVPAGRAAPAIDLLADVVLDPTFPEDALETERRVALANVAQQRDDMYRYPVRLAMQAAYGATSVRPLGARHRADVRRDRCADGPRLASRSHRARPAGDRGRRRRRPGRGGRAVGDGVRAARDGAHRADRGPAVAGAVGGAGGIARQGSDRAGRRFRRSRSPRSAPVRDGVDRHRRERAWWSVLRRAPRPAVAGVHGPGVRAASACSPGRSSPTSRRRRTAKTWRAAACSPSSRSFASGM